MSLWQYVNGVPLITPCLLSPPQWLSGHWVGMGLLGASVAGHSLWMVLFDLDGIYSARYFKLFFICTLFMRTSSDIIFDTFDILDFDGFVRRKILWGGIGH